MIAPPDPALPYVAPPILINVPAGTQPGCTGHALRLKATPHLLLPSPPFSPAVRTLKAVETFVKTVVPVGHRVQCSVGLDGSSGDPDGGFDAGSPALEEVVKIVMTVLSETLDLSCSPARNTVEPSPSQTSAATLLSAAPDHFMLATRSAQPREHDRINGLIMTGLPRAFLTKLEISCIWVRPALGGRKPALKSSICESEGSEEEVGMAPGTEDEQGESRQLSAGEPGVPNTSSAIEQSLEQTSCLSIDSPWRDQMSEALVSLSTQHLIRRFPLVFDRRVPEFAETLGIPRALMSSFSSLRLVSAKHDTELNRDIGRLLCAIHGQRLSRIAFVVQEAARIPELASRKREFAKKRAAQDRRERKAQKRLKKRDGNARQNANIDTPDEPCIAATEDLLDATSRINAYLLSTGGDFDARGEHDPTIYDVDVGEIVSQALLWMAASTYFTPKKLRWRQGANPVNSQRFSSDSARDTTRLEDQADEAKCKQHSDRAERPAEDQCAANDRDDMSDFEWAHDTDDDYDDQGDLNSENIRLSLILEAGITEPGRPVWKTGHGPSEGEIPRLACPASGIIDTHYESSHSIGVPHQEHRDATIDSDESLPDMPSTPTASVAIYSTALQPDLASLKAQPVTWQNITVKDDTDFMMSDVSDSLSCDFDRMSMAPDSDMEFPICM